MELQQTISELLTLVAAILMTATVAIPLTVLVAQAAEKKMPRWRAALRPRLGRMTTLMGVGAVPDRRVVRRPVVRAPSSPSVEMERRRAQKRFRTCMMGSLHRGTVTRADNLCDVIDLSSGGARIRLVDPMAQISRMTLGLRHFGFFPARVVWCTADEIGLKFDLAPETVVARMRGLLPEPAAAAAY